MNEMGAPRECRIGLDSPGRQRRHEDRTRFQRGLIPRHKGWTVTTVLSLMLLAILLASSLHFLGGAKDDPHKARTSYTTHAPIIVWQDAGFNATNGVSSGTGAADDPYIVSGWEISTESMGACIFVFRTAAHFVIQSCYLHCPGAVCLETEEAPHGDIVNCVIDTGDYGIILVKSPDSNITGNVISNMDTTGITVSQSRWVNVTGNQATQGSSWGIGVSTSHNVSLQDNVVSNNGASGILMANSTYLMVAGNNASGNGGDGLRLDNVTNADVRDNNITANSGYGLNLTRSSFVDVFHNRFIGNPLQAYQEDVTDVAWDDGYPSGGNYWSDYTGIDGNGDGIGDTPYAVSGGGTDRYPFVDESMVFVPEFSALLVPIASIVGAVVAFSSRRRRGDQA